MMLRFLRRRRAQAVLSVPSSAPRIAQDADRAIYELKKRGHTKGKLMDDFGRVCAMGAVNVAFGSPRGKFTLEINSRARDDLIRALYVEVPKIHHYEAASTDSIALMASAIERYNDRIASTEDVLRLFNNVITKNLPPTNATQADLDLAGGPSV